jgi:hypothetical protein
MAEQPARSHTGARRMMRPSIAKVYRMLGVLEKTRRRLRDQHLDIKGRLAAPIITSSVHAASSAHTTADGSARSSRRHLTANTENRRHRPTMWCHLIRRGRANRPGRRSITVASVASAAMTGYDGAIDGRIIIGDGDEQRKAKYFGSPRYCLEGVCLGRP